MANKQKRVTGEAFQLSHVHGLLDGWHGTITSHCCSTTPINSGYWINNISGPGQVVTLQSVLITEHE